MGGGSGLGGNRGCDAHANPEPIDSGKGSMSPVPYMKYVLQHIHFDEFLIIRLQYLITVLLSFIVGQSEGAF